MMRPAPLAALLLALSFAAAPAAAQVRAQIDVRYSTDYGRCIHKRDATRGVTTAKVKCLRKEADRQKERLGESYQLAKSRLKGSQRKKLRQAERQWAKGLKAGCKAQTGGSNATLGYVACIVDETIKRTIWLERYRE